MDLRGAVVVVTGASSGIGEATALRFARCGSAVVLAARRVERLEALAERIGSNGARALAVRCDVEEPAEVRALVARTHEAFGRCDVLVNNAGIPGGGPFRGLDAEHIERIVRVNLLGVLLVTKAFLPSMLERGRGHVVNVASLAGRFATPGSSVYGATKHGVVAFSESLYHELRPFGVLVTVVNPWFVSTEGFPQSDIPRRLLMPADRVARTIADVVRRGRVHPPSSRPPLDLSPPRFEAIPVPRGHRSRGRYPATVTQPHGRARGRHPKATRSEASALWPIADLWEQAPHATQAIDAVDVPATGIFGNDLEDPRERSHEGLPHLLTRHSLRRMQAEARHSGFDDGSLFAWSIPDAIVLHQDDPTPSTGLAKPNLVVRVLREDVVVSDHGSVDSAEPLRHFAPPQAAVAEELRLRGARARGA